MLYYTSNVMYLRKIALKSHRKQHRDVQLNAIGRQTAKRGSNYSVRYGFNHLNMELDLKIGMTERRKQPFF